MAVASAALLLVAAASAFPQVVAWAASFLAAAMSAFPRWGLPGGAPSGGLVAFPQVAVASARSSGGGCVGDPSGGVALAALRQAEAASAIHP